MTCRSSYDSAKSINGKDLSYCTVQPYYNIYYRTSKSKTCGTVRMPCLLMQLVNSLPHFSLIGKCQYCYCKQSYQIALILDLMMGLLCIAKLLWPLMYSTVSYPTVRNFVQCVNTERRKCDLVEGEEAFCKSSDESRISTHSSHVFQICWLHYANL